MPIADEYIIVFHIWCTVKFFLSTAKVEYNQE